MQLFKRFIDIFYIEMGNPVPFSVVFRHGTYFYFSPPAEECPLTHDVMFRINGLLPIVRNCGYQKGRCFGNWISFRLHVKGDTYSVGSLRKSFID
jgi:hypothetical protein